jgi:multidrug efflux pump subunit AcrB
MIALASLLPISGFIASRSLGRQFFPPVDRDMFDVKLWLPSEASIERTRDRVQAIEAVLREEATIRRVDWLIGGSFPSVYYNAVMERDDSSHYAQAVVTATSSEEVKRLIPVLQQRFDDAFPEAQLVVTQFAQGPPVEADVEFRVYGPSIETLQDLGDAIRLRLAEHPDTLHTQASMGRGEPKLWLDADEEEARLAGLTLADVATQLQGSFEGTVGGSVIEELEELAVRIRFDDDRRDEIADIGAAQLTAPGRSGWTPLSVLGELELRPEVAGITRHNGLRANLIHGHTRNGALAINVTHEVLAELEREGFVLPAGYEIAIGGDAEDERAAVGNLMIYLPVLVTLMASTIILSFRSVRLAAVLGAVAMLSVGLAFLATWAYGFPVSFMTILGTIGLIGVGLNDSIVVLAAIRSNPDAREGDAQAIADEVLGTLRHVISTTLTTVGGFLPLLIFVGGDFWPPLAIVLAGGVSGATILAVVFVPAAYRLVMTTRLDFPWLAHARRLAPSRDGGIS